MNWLWGIGGYAAAMMLILGAGKRQRQGTIKADPSDPSGKRGLNPGSTEFPWKEYF